MKPVIHKIRCSNAPQKTLNITLYTTNTQDLIYLLQQDVSFKILFICIHDSSVFVLWRKRALCGQERDLAADVFDYFALVS